MLKVLNHRRLILDVLQHIAASHSKRTFEETLINRRGKDDVAHLSLVLRSSTANNVTGSTKTSTSCRVQSCDFKVTSITFCTGEGALNTPTAGLKHTGIRTTQQNNNQPAPFSRPSASSGVQHCALSYIYGSIVCKERDLPTPSPIQTSLTIILKQDGTDNIRNTPSQSSMYRTSQKIFNPIQLPSPRLLHHTT